MVSYTDIDKTLAGGLLPGGEPLRKDPYEEAKANCKAKGGTWDVENNVCILPEPKPEPTPKPVVKGAYDPERKGFVKETGEFFPSEDPSFVPQQTDTRIEFLGQGNVRITSEDGQVANLSREEYKTYLGEGGTVTPNVQKARAIEPAARRQAALQQAIGQIGQIGTLTAAEQADINLSQAFTAGAAKVIPSAVGAAAGGALVGGIAGAGVGSTVTAPAGAIIGGVGGAVTGFVSGVLGDIKEQQRGELQAADIELTNARTTMRQLAMLASQDPANADIYIGQYNQILTRVYQARRQTKAEVTGDLNAFMEDGREQLADFDAFLQPGGIADVYGQKLQVALSSGTPLSFNGEELLV